MIDYIYMTKVSVEQGRNRRNLAKSVVKDLPNFIDRLKKAKQIFIKPNLIHHERSLAVTHIDTIRGVLDIIREYSQIPVIIGDAGFTGTSSAFRHFGYNLLPEEYEKVTLLDLNEDDYVIGYSYRADGELYKIHRSKTVSDCDFRISIAPMKVHSSLGASLSVENWTFGTWLVPPRIGPLGRVWARWPWLEEQGIDKAHQTIAKMFEDIPFDLGIVDGVLAMEGEGPIDGDAVDMRIMLASFDPIALDAVSATLMGIDPENIPYLIHLAESKKGIIDLTKIDVPPMIISECRRTFMTPDHQLNK